MTPDGLKASPLDKAAIREPASGTSKGRTRRPDRRRRAITGSIWSERLASGAAIAGMLGEAIAAHHKPVGRGEPVPGRRLVEKRQRFTAPAHPRKREGSRAPRVTSTPWPQEPQIALLERKHQLPTATQSCALDHHLDDDEATSAGR